MPKVRPLRLAAASSLAPLGTPAGDVALSERQKLFERPVALSAVETFEKLLGGKTKLLEDLLGSPEITPNIRKVLTLMLDPRYADMPLSALCARSDVLPGEVFAAFRDATLAKTTIQALVEVSNRLPKITVDYLMKAVDHQRVCPECSGSRKMLVHGAGKAKRKMGRPKAGAAPDLPPDQIIDCLRCNGEGVIVVDADQSRQETVFEIMGLLKQGSGININQTNQTIQANQSPDPSGALGGLEQLQQVVSGVLFGRTAMAPVIEGEIEAADTQRLQTDADPAVPPPFVPSEELPSA